jgi:peptidoglycan/xylan/chitin deacetylase (PgdA/CDA1 family)
MTSTRSTQAGAEPRSTQTRFGIPVREIRLRTRILLLRLLSASPLPALAKRLQPRGDLILCLHNVVESHGPLGVNRGLDLTVGELEAVLAYLRAEGYRPVALEDICLQREPDRRSGEKRVAITFDDGYAGNLHVAYPVLRRHGVPFTVYVTTGFMDRDVRVWWYALERLLAEVESVAFEHTGRPYGYTTLTRAQKIHAYRSISALLLEAEPRAADRILEQLFAGRVADLRELGAGDVLTAEQVRVLSQDPLVTIGAHSISHQSLRQLSHEACRREIRGCRERLLSVTGGPIDHFAYPFGNRAACGPREERLARECGYATATTTSARQVEATDRSTALPRIMLTAELDVLAALRALLTGWFGRRD